MRHWVNRHVLHMRFPAVYVVKVPAAEPACAGETGPQVGGEPLDHPGTPPLAGLAAMAVFSHRDRRTRFLVLNVAGAVVVTFTLVVNLARGAPLVSLAVALLVSGVLYRTWTRAGRPGGVRNIATASEGSEGTAHVTAP